MPDVNEALFDAANRNQTFLIRFGGGSARRINELLTKAEEDLVRRIAARVDRLGPAARSTLGSKRLKSILAAVKKQNADLMVSLRQELTRDLNGVARQEVDIASRRLDEAVGVDLNNFRPTPAELSVMVRQNGVGGRTLRQWFSRLGADRLGRLEGAVNLGVIEGDTIPQIVRRFRQSEDVTRRSAEALVRTHVNHIGNQAREALYEANSDIVEELRWTATLDGRTSAICRARDGTTYELDQGPRPPAHPNCRSIMTPVLKSWEKLAKPGALKPGRGSSQIDKVFDKNLKKQGFTKSQIKKIKRDTRASMNGQVPGDISYQDWLKRQPAGFQKDVLGQTKFKLFRDGDLSLDRFVDETTGRGLTLAEIKTRNGEAWMSAGIPNEN